MNHARLWGIAGGHPLPQVGWECVHRFWRGLTLLGALECVRAVMLCSDRLALQLQRWVMGWQALGAVVVVVVLHTPCDVTLHVMPLVYE